ncbi:2'-5' RNA ligase family protein [Actinokineospora enzanensis]|uniref:2'-5' RNA ligase family protein n=1 Tax=Actinokineospora enzanensis TaxID=155975 RepID=UPI0003732759|nr:2'-5' RNA ligase family protein [Actinokineospora enzanensis]
MQNFFTPQRVWSQRQLPHIYYLPAPGALNPLTTAYAPVLTNSPALTPVPVDWLHATLVKIRSTIPLHARDELVAALTATAGTQPVMTMTAGPAMASRSAIVLDLVPDHLWNQVRAALAATVETVLGPGSTSLGERPHITLAYGRAEADSGHLQSRLRQLTDHRVELHIDSAHLVEVTQHPDLGGYRWASPTTPLAFATAHNSP